MTDDRRQMTVDSGLRTEDSENRITEQKQKAAECESRCCHQMKASCLTGTGGGHKRESLTHGQNAL
jgi:hypothetical protein